MEEKKKKRIYLVNTHNKTKSEIMKDAHTNLLNFRNIWQDKIIN